MRKNLLSLFMLTIFLCGCSLNNESTLESIIKSDEPIEDKSFKAKIEVGVEILSQVPDDYFIDYYKAIMNYRFL